ncbi:MAG: hypothetical protein IJS78_05995 [Clostridia bacterium]|nr:hypothetical protein [Clostridia bacterium]
MKKPSFPAAAALLSLVLVLLLSLSSCGEKYEEDEIIAAAASLVADSGAINEIYFGDGLPFAEKGDWEDLYPWYVPPTPPADGSADLGYYMIKPQSGFLTVDDIKAATLRVYTKEYSEILFTGAFSGLAVTVGEGGNAEKQAVSLARYIDADGGYLAGRRVTEEEKLPLGRTYDTDGIRVERQRGNTATVVAPSVAPSGEKEDVRLTLKMTADGWRLDTPTY